MSKKNAALMSKTAAIALACAVLIIFSGSSRRGVEDGIEMCLGVLIPSLFPFMAVTDLLIKSGVIARAGQIFSKPASALFGLSGAIAPVIIMSMLGGYPVGACAISSLYEQRAISKTEAERAALFCVCAGPGFVISFAGTSVYGSERLGWIIFISQVLSVILLGLFTRLMFGKVNDNSKTELSKQCEPFSSALVKSVSSASRGLLGICAYVLLFSAATGILEQTVHSEKVRSAAFLTLEVCTAVLKLSDSLPVWLIAFAIGFGGICVHMQLFSVLGEASPPKGLFFLFRIIQGGITAALTYAGLRIFPETAAVFSTTAVQQARFGSSILSGAALIFISVCFLLSIKNLRR